jgi:hypothetical protein
MSVWWFLGLCLAAVVVNWVIAALAVNGGTERQEWDERTLRDDIEHRLRRAQWRHRHDD